VKYNINPFQELYVTDDPDPFVYVGLFSNMLVEHVMPLFRPGNVILKGIQGTGKSMLLNLFRPKIRLAFDKANIPFPIPDLLQNFISAGINLSRSGIMNFGHRPIAVDSDLSEMPLYFGDFLNYFIVADIINNLKTHISRPTVFSANVSRDYLEDFSLQLSKQDCWFGYLDNCKNFKEVFDRLNKRINSYRQFHANRLYTLNKEIKITKTNPGEPISRTAQLLKDTGVVKADTNFFIRIDQVEILLGGDIANKNLGLQYRQILNKILGDRDARVSYKIGTRRYDWDKALNIYGTSNRLENLRDYRVIDIDDILRRKEDSKTWIFPRFANDVFGKRLVNSEIIQPEENQDKLFTKFFGTVRSNNKIAYYISNKKNTASPSFWDKNKFPKVWDTYLNKLNKNDPLEALLASTWAQQGTRRGKPNERLQNPPPTSKPWNKPWWRKERIPQALMQIASKSSQRMLWAGKDDIIGLSSGNISVLLSICYEIWEMFLRYESRKANDKNPIFSDCHFDEKIQTMGIHNASHVWYKKISEQPNGDDRKNFINFLGTQFKKWLSNDRTMSYPGHNGFSIANEMFDTGSVSNDLKLFLNDAVDYGDLFDSLHTTKKKDRKERIKWYLNPILSPYFQIPHQHIKEPYYLENLEKLFDWIVEKSNACLYLRDKKLLLASQLSKIKPKSKPRRTADNSPTLFDYIEERNK
jgi:hypothetical protein